MTSFNLMPRLISNGCRFCHSATYTSHSYFNSLNNFEQLWRRGSSSNSVSEKTSDVEKLQKRLDIAVVGHPNAGKSTLVNYLCGKTLMPVSSKVHTTRSAMQGFLTQGNTQLIFWDTPGLVSRHHKRRHKLPDSIYDDPRTAFLQCDLIALMVDCVDGRHSRKIPFVVKEQFSKLFSTVSSLPDKQIILLLNKIDIFKGSKRDLRNIIKVLTEGYIGGKSIESANTRRNIGKGILTMDFSSTVKKGKVTAVSEKETNGDNDDKNELNVSSFEYNVNQTEPKVVKNTILDSIDKDNEAFFNQLLSLKRHRGFNGFSAVFPISALNGYGLEKVQEYFLSQARPGKFEVEDGVRTNATIEKVIENAIVSRVYENLPNHLPYKIKIEIQDLFQTEEQILVVAVLTTPYQMGLVLGENAETLKKIVAESRQLISDIVETPIKLSLTVEER